MPITDQQGALRRQLADNMRADSDAIHEHLNLVDYMAPSADGTFWFDRPGAFGGTNISTDWGSHSSKEAHRHLVNALALKVRNLLPSLCRDVLEDAAKRAGTAIARFSDTAPSEDATAISKVLGATLPSAPASVDTPDEVIDHITLPDGANS